MFYIGLKHKVLICTEKGRGKDAFASSANRENITKERRREEGKEIEKGNHNRKDPKEKRALRGGLSLGLVLGNSLGTLRNSVLGQLSREEETDSGLNLARSDGGLLVVTGKTARLGGNTLEDILDEGVHDLHSLLGDTSVGVNLLQHTVDVGGVGGIVALLPPLLVLISGLLHRLLGGGFGLGGGSGLGGCGGLLGRHIELIDVVVGCFGLGVGDFVCDEDVERLGRGKCMDDVALFGWWLYGGFGILDFGIIYGNSLFGPLKRNRHWWGDLCFFLFVCFCWYSVSLDTAPLLWLNPLLVSLLFCSVRESVGKLCPQCPVQNKKGEM